MRKDDTSSAGDEDDISSVHYAVRFHSNASTEILVEKTRYIELSGETIANDWGESLLKSIAKLSYQAPFLQLAAEDPLFSYPVRVLRFQRRRGAPLYRILLRLRDGLDGPQVVVLTIRHGAAAMMTAEEAHRLEQEE